MALRLLDFPSAQPGLYGTDDSLLLNGRYAEFGNFQSFDLVDDPDPNITGNVCRFTIGAGWTGNLRWVLPSSQTKVGIARRVWLPQLPGGTGNHDLIQWRNGANGTIGYVRVDTTGRLVVNGGGSEQTTTNPVLVANAWQHVEMMMNTAEGTMEVRVEGVTVMSRSGLTIVGPIAQLAVVSSGGNSGERQYLKDLATWDGSGSFNNNFLGSIQVYDLLPSSDVAFPWAASTGTTGWDLIDESPPNDDTDYIYAIDPPPAASKFGLTDLPIDVTSVKGLEVVVRSRKTDGGDGNLQVGMVSGASTTLGADRAITTADTYWADVFETDPVTGAAWLRSAVNAANLQLNRTV